MRAPTPALFIATLAVLLFWTAIGHAYPWMLKHGYSGCSTCHVDPAGGELLNGYGRAQGFALLAADYGRSRQTAPEGVLWGAFDPQPVALGGSYRHLTVVEPSEGEVATFPMQADLYLGLDHDLVVASVSVGAARVDPGSPHARAAQVTRGQGDQLNAISRVHWLGLRIAPRTVLRGGRINLPFGLRIPEHTMWVRETTRTDRESDQQHGLSIAHTGADFRAEAMLVLGNYQIRPDRYRERGYAAFAEWQVSEPVALGASSLVTRAFADRVTLVDDATTRHAHGLFIRSELASPLYLMAEANALITTRRDPGYVGFVQLDYEPWQGVHFMATGEALDQGAASDQPASTGAGKPRFGAWGTVDYYFLPQLSLRVDAIYRTEDPVTLLAQVHLYL